MDRFFIMSRTSYEPELREQILEAARESFPIFKKQPGLISMRMHEAHDHTHTMTVMEWQSKEHSEACMRSSDFGDWNGKWQSLMSSGKARWELLTYDLLHEHPAG